MTKMIFHKILSLLKLYLGSIIWFDGNKEFYISYYLGAAFIYLFLVVGIKLRTLSLTDLFPALVAPE